MAVMVKEMSTKISFWRYVSRNIWFMPSTLIWFGFGIYITYNKYQEYIRDESWYWKLAEAHFSSKQLDQREYVDGIDYLVLQDYEYWADGQVYFAEREYATGSAVYVKQYQPKPIIEIYYDTRNPSINFDNINHLTLKEDLIMTVVLAAMIALFGMIGVVWKYQHEN